MFLGRSPLRISFGGGGTDLEEFHSKHEGNTVSFTIDLFTTLMARLRGDKKFQGFSPDFESHNPPQNFSRINVMKGHEIIVNTLKEMNFKKGVDLFFCSDVAPGSGLGASSSMTTNLVSVLLKMNGKKWSKTRIALQSFKIAHDKLTWNVGKQDEFAAVYGGLNHFNFNGKKVNVTRLHLTKSTFHELQENSMLFSIGNRNGSSSSILKEQSSNIQKKKVDTIEALKSASQLALEMRDCLKINDITKFGELINKNWEQKKKFASNVSNNRIEKLIDLTIKKGALGAKLTGAGGGGHLYVYAEPSHQKRIIHQMEKLGAKKVPFSFTFSGTTVLDTKNL